MRRVPLPVALLLAALFQPVAAPAANMIADGGFEAIKDGKLVNWTVPEYWAGEIAPETDKANVHGGARSAKLTAVDKGGKHWARTLTAGNNALPPLRYRYTAWVKGTGAAKLGVINYRPKKEGENPYVYAWTDPVTLTADWQQLTFEFTPLQIDVYRITPTIEIEGQGAVAWLDDAVLEIVGKPGELRFSRAYTMLRPGESPNLSATVVADGQPIANAKLALIRVVGEGLERAEATADANGVVKLDLPAADTAEVALREYRLASADLGQVASAWVDVVDPATYAAFEQAAKATKVTAPAHLLFLGDSLSDQQRGRNYCDQVAFWLQRVHGEQVTWLNAGVGGDYITRMLERLTGEKKAYRQEMYATLFEPKPTAVFIFLGHNDTKLTPASKHTEAVVLPDAYAAEFRQVLEIIRKNSSPKITLLSSTSSVFEICQANMEKATAAGRASTLFGKPEVLEQYNGILKKVADETGCGWLDVYNPTKNHPAKPTLFNERDGVHLSLAGNHLIALEMLKYLGQ